MSEDLDRRLAERLTAAAPAESDPVFRVGVLKRREEDAYRTRSRIVVAGGVAIAAVAALGLFLRPDLIDEAGIALVAVAAGGAAWLFSPTVRRLAKHLTP